MRTIKFRCWDEENKKMWPYAAPLLGRNKINVSCQENGGFNDFVKGVLLQFTGLHDVDGKEVFEGDVFKWLFNGKKFVVSFEDGCFQAGDWDLNLFKDIRVIGNIFENPELLNGGQHA